MASAPVGPSFKSPLCQSVAMFLTKEVRTATDTYFQEIVGRVTHSNIKVARSRNMSPYLPAHCSVASGRSRLLPQSSGPPQEVQVSLPPPLPSFCPRRGGGKPTSPEAHGAQAACSPECSSISIPTKPPLSEDTLA